MAKSVGLREWQQAVILLAGVTVLAVVIVALYCARSVFIPLTMAAFLTFLLNPLVVWLRRHGLRRTPSVVVAVLITALVLTIVGWMATSQISSLLRELPDYTQTMTEKIRSLKRVAGRSAPISKMVTDVYNEIVLPASAAKTKEESPGEAISVGRDRPRTVVIESGPPSWLGRLATFLDPLMEFLAQLALALVLLIFMLHKPDELRNRIIRLLGDGRLVATTRFVDEAGQRISRFLLLQAMVNSAVGVVIGGGLYLIGVRYALLWGFLTAMFRYLPYIGTMMAVAFPTLISFAMSRTLAPTLMVVGLYLVAELVVANIIEPRLYGQSMGVSEIALLVSAAFWASFWGPIGLVLSSPLTVCLVSLGRYVPQLEFLWVLLGDGPPLEPEVHFYQRLLARDEGEAMELVVEKLRSDGVDSVYDGILIPALRAAKLNHQQELISDADFAFIISATRAIVDELEMRAAQVPGAVFATESDPSPVGAASEPPIPIIGCPGHGEGDRLALEMLRALLDPRQWRLELIGPRTLVAELIEVVAASNASLVCIANATPGGLPRARYLSKRLRASFPDLRILVCRSGLEVAGRGDPAGLKKAGADAVTGSLVETRERLASLRPVLAAKQKEPVRFEREPAETDPIANQGAREPVRTASATI
jgi:predicted PurR-regulated permease PerM